MEQLLATIISILGTYGICHLLVHEDAPYGLFVKLRKRIKAFRCVPCSVVWIALLVAFFMEIGLIGYLAVVGGVIFMDKIEL